MSFKDVTKTDAAVRTLVSEYIRKNDNATKTVAPGPFVECLKNVNFFLGLVIKPPNVSQPNH